MNYTISATTRTQKGRQARQMFTEGRIPAVLYGHGIEPKVISILRSDFVRLYRTAGTSALVDVAVDSGATVKTLIQDVQTHPTSLQPMHVDFRQVRMDQKIHVTVPLVFVGESLAVKANGGTLVTNLNQVEVSCLPADLPHEIAVDISPLATFEDHITVTTLKLPAGVEVLGDQSLVVATVSRPLTEEELKKLEESQLGDVSAIKTEADEKKTADEAKKVEEDKAAAAAK